MRSEAIKAHAASQSKSATSGGLNPAADVSRPQYKALNADVSRDSSDTARQLCATSP